jgi:hypothetical protein
MLPFRKVFVDLWLIAKMVLERYVAEGWDVQTVLPSGRIHIRGFLRNEVVFKIFEPYYSIT